MKSQYLEYANKAAELECNGELLAAALAWVSAGIQARNVNNTHWANSRSQLCQKRAKQIKSEAV